MLVLSTVGHEGMAGPTVACALPAAMWTMTRAAVVVQTEVARPGPANPPMPLGTGGSGGCPMLVVVPACLRQPYQELAAPCRGG